MPTLSVAPRGVRVGLFAGLCGLYACIHLDRQALGILAQSVKSDLALDDGQLGALTGSAFSIVYALLGLYFGRLADRSDRLRLVRIGAWVWSLASLAAAFAPAYWALVATRAGVATGEAIATAAAVSLMSELASERRRAAAASIFFSMAFVGAGLAAIGGGAIVAACRDSLGAGAWRVAIGAAGLPGIFGALYLARFKWQESPERGSSQPASSPRITVMLVTAAAAAVLIQLELPAARAVPAAVMLGVIIAGVWAVQMRRSAVAAYAATFGQTRYRWFLLSFAALLLLDYAAAFWLIPYAQRRFGASAAVVGAELGGLMIVGGIAGALSGGWLADRWQSRRGLGHILTALIAVLAEVAAILAALHQGDFNGFVVAFAAICLASGGWTGVAAAIAFDIVPAAHRGTGTAGYFLVTTLLGPGLGPFLVGVGSDVSGSIGRALEWSCLVAAISIAGLLRLGFIEVTARRSPA